MFNVSTPKRKFNANAVHFGGNHPYVVRSSQNNGRRGCIIADKKWLNPAGTISFGQDTATIFYQDEPYFTGDKIKVMSLKSKPLDARAATYLIVVMRKAFSAFAWGVSSFDENVLKQVEIILPVVSQDSDEIDFAYMEARIRELEEARIRELEAYLTAAGFANCGLTTDEQAALAGFGAKPFKPFKIGSLYDKCDLRNKPFDKRKDTAPEPSDEYPIPLANAKHGDNGVMFYGREAIFPSEELTLDIVQNGAIATGDVYPQPQRTGVIWDAYLIKATTHTDTESTLCYMAAAVEKSIKVRYNYDKKATWDRVKAESVILPVDSTGEPDLAFMETYVRAQMKEAIQGVWAWRGREIETTRAVSSGPAAHTEALSHQGMDYSDLISVPTSSLAAQEPSARSGGDAPPPSPSVEYPKR